MSSRLGSAGLAPYTDEEDATTTWGMPWRRAASSTIMVPVALAWWVAMGSASERGTDGRAARWTTAWAPSMTASRSSSRRMEPSLSSTEGQPARFGREPVDRSSRATTWSTKSCWASIRHRLAPMNPAPPVTTTFTTGQIRSQRLDPRPPDPVAGVEHVPCMITDHVVVEVVVIGHHHHSVGRLHLVLRQLHQGHAGDIGRNVGVDDSDVGAERSEAVEDDHPGGLTSIPRVPLVGQPQQQDAGAVDRASLPVEGQGQPGHHVVGHVLVDVIGQLHEPEGLAEAPADRPRQVAGIDGQAVSPHPRTGREPEVAERLGRRGIDGLPDIDA